MKIDYTSIGLRIRKLRKQKFLTQEKLAEKAEIAPDYLCRIELGKKHPSLKAILLIANALDTTVDSLLIDAQKQDDFFVRSEELSLFTGCTENQKRLLFAIFCNIKETLINHDIDQNKHFPL